MADGEPEYDLVVVGSGAAGMTAALTAALHGLRAVVIEKTISARFMGRLTRARRPDGRPAICAG